MLSNQPARESKSTEIMQIFPANYSGLIKIEIVAKGFQGRKRLEDFLFDRLPHFTRSQIRKAIREFGCEINGWPANRGTPVRQNDFIELYSDHATASFIFPKKGKIQPIYEDHEILVINKPSGVLVHPSHRDKTGTLLETVYYHINRDLFCEEQFFRLGGIANHQSAMPSSEKIGPENFQTIFLDDDAELKSYKRPGLVHRLDLDTSGVLVIAKTKRAHRKLSLQFQQRKVTKKYLAVVDGAIEEEEGEFRFPIARDAAKKMWIVSDNGKPSLTRFKVVERSTALSLLLLDCVTGRTNQLRIHCAAAGYPILGDTERGGKKASRLFLHAWSLTLRHPASGQIMEFVSEPDGDFKDLIVSHLPGAVERLSRHLSGHLDSVKYNDSVYNHG